MHAVTLVCEPDVPGLIPLPPLPLLGCQVHLQLGGLGLLCPSLGRLPGAHRVGTGILGVIHRGPGLICRVIMVTVSLLGGEVGRSEVALAQHAVHPHQTAQPGRNHLGEDSPAQMCLGEVQTMANHLGADSPAKMCLGKLQTPALTYLGEVQAMPNHLGVDMLLTVQLGRGRD